MADSGRQFVGMVSASTGDQHGGDSLLGSPITIRPTVEADTIVVERPDGEKMTLELTNSAQVIYADTSQTGLYQVEVKLGDDVVQRDAFAINLFDPAEAPLPHVMNSPLSPLKAKPVSAARRQKKRVGVSYGRLSPVWGCSFWASNGGIIIET